MQLAIKKAAIDCLAQYTAHCLFYRLKVLGEGEWKHKKHQPEYRRQWRKFHIGIDVKTLQIWAVQLTTNNVSGSQVLVSYLIKFHKKNKLTQSIPMVLMTLSFAVK